MDAKLTLKFDEQVVEKAKKYAATHKRSLSRIIESYLQTLTSEENDANVEEIQISSFVKSLSVKSNLPADFDYKKEISDHYTEKYK